MKIGYARVSSSGQSLDVQLEALAQICEKIYREKQSGKSTDGRPELEHALEALRPGDELVVTRLDRLARSVPDLYAIVQRIVDAGAEFSCLQQGAVDTRSATGKLMLAVLGAVAEFERNLLLERQREGIARAKAAGKYRKDGRKTRLDPAVVRAAYAEAGTYGAGARLLAERGVACSKASGGRVVKGRARNGKKEAV